MKPIEGKLWLVHFSVDTKIMINESPIEMEWIKMFSKSIAHMNAKSTRLAYTNHLNN